MVDRSVPNTVDTGISAAVIGVPDSLDDEVPIVRLPPARPVMSRVHGDCNADVVDDFLGSFVDRMPREAVQTANFSPASQMTLARAIDKPR